MSPVVIGGSSQCGVYFSTVRCSLEEKTTNKKEKKVAVLIKGIIQRKKNTRYVESYVRTEPFGP